ncbi:MAG: BTAD domain-containing putative transcriptional regulator [Cyanobacteria bacterium J06635_15]
MAQVLHIRLLGGFSLTYGDRPLTDLTQGRAQLLLAYLALHHATPQPRQRVAFHLWPESTDAQARTNLRKALSHLRRSLPNVETLLKTGTKSLHWLSSEDCQSDVAAFEAAINTAEQSTDNVVRQTHWEQAIQLYQGDLLPDCEDEWLAPERERLRQLYQRSLEQLIQLLENQQDYSTANTYAQQLVRLDNLNEAVYCTLMRLQHGVGDRAGALQTYHQCMTILQDELGVDPGAATRQLYEQLLHEDEALLTPTQPPSTPQPVALPVVTLNPSMASTPLVGREAEWDTIQQWGEPLLTGTQQSAKPSQGKTRATPMLLLQGEPGIGKTRLLEELCTTVQTADVRLLWGCGFAAEMMRPYGMWIDALRSSDIVSIPNLPTELGFLMPELGHPSQTLPDPSHLFDAVVRSLLQWADQSPLLLLFDDIQWMDDASAALLHYVIRVLHHHPMQIACTARSGELEVNAALTDVLKALRREQRLHCLELSPLDREQTRHLLRSTGNLAPSELSLSLINQVFVDSGGNPLFALELARSRGYQSGDASTLESLIGDRLQQLDDSTRGILPWAAAMGRNFSPAMIAQIADMPIAQLLSAIEQLEQQSIICPNAARQLGGCYDFTHGIVRQVVYKQLSAPRRRLIHQQIAYHLYQQVNQDEAIASDVAHHAFLGEDFDLAAEMAILAVEQSLKLFAYTAAVEHARQGFRAAEQLGHRIRITRQAKLLNLCALAGVQGETAAQLTTQAQQLVEDAQAQQLPEAETNALEALIIVQFNQSDFDGVHRYSLQAAAASRVANPAVVARTLAYSGGCLAEIGRDIPRAEALLLEAQSLAERVDLENFDIFAGLGAIHRHYGRYDEARSLISQALHLTHVHQEHWRECHYLSYLAMIELETENPAAVFPHMAAMLEAAAKIQGEGSEAAIAQALTALAQYQLREPAAAETLPAAIAALQRADAKRVLASILMRAAAIDLEDANLPLAYERATAALNNARAINHPSQIALSWAVLVQSLLKLGDPEQALAEFQQLQETADFHNVSATAQTAIAEAQQILSIPAHPVP